MHPSWRSPLAEEPLDDPESPLDILVVGAGPSGLATGAAARKAGLDVLLLDRGGLCEGIRGYPTDMLFFTTRERLEIADVPFAIPDPRPSRRQALAYYREVARHWQIPLVLHEEVTAVRRKGEAFVVESRRAGVEKRRLAHAVVLATGYFGKPLRLGVPGEGLPWVHDRFREPYGHFGDHVLIVGGGNSGAEAALELFRWGAQVTLVHRGPALRTGVKYWLKPDVENRIAEGSIRGLFETSVEAFTEEGTVLLRSRHGQEVLAVDAAYVLVGYAPELELARFVGVTLDPETQVPRHDPETCETDVPGFYVAGTIQAGRFTNRIFIENSRTHGQQIVSSVLAKRGQGASPRSAATPSFAELVARLPPPLDD